MKAKFTLKGSVLIFLCLHTATVVLFAYLILRGGVLPDGLLLAISLVLSTFLAVYTTYKINRIVSQEFAAAMKVVCKFSDYLKGMSEKLHDNAKAIEQRAILVNNCANAITELVKDLDSPDDGINS